MYKYIIISISVLLFFSCNSKNKKNQTTETNKKAETEKVIELQNNYAFIQGKNIEKSKEILFVVIDPHAKGQEAVLRFKKLTENVNCTVIGLTDVMNGQKDFMTKIKNDIDAAIKTLELNPIETYFVGFSGGGQMAFNYGISNNANGILMCGIGGVQEIYNLGNIPLAMIIGLKDFNFVGNYYSPYSEIIDIDNFIRFVFDGIHEWAPENLIYNASVFLLNKNNKKITPEFDGEKSFEIFKNKNQLFMAFNALEVAYKMSSDSIIKKQIKNFLETPKFKSYITEFEAGLFSENDRRQDYINYLNTKNLDWWKDEIKEIEKLSKSSDNQVSNSYVRTKAFLGVLMYMYVSNEINNQNSPVIDKYLSIYKLVEPNNPDYYFYQAVRDLQTDKKQESSNNLDKAFELGFSDSLKVNQFFK